MVSVGDILQFFNQMDNDLKTAAEMSIEEQDRLCREKGWPTVTEQKQHWDGLSNGERIVLLFEKNTSTLKTLLQAVEGLQEIVKNQQEQINALKR